MLVPESHWAFLLSPGLAHRFALVLDKLLAKALLRLGVLFRDSSVTLKILSHFAHIPMAGTVPSHFVTLRFAFAMLTSLPLH